jgi:hypothetical protein
MGEETEYDIGERWLILGSSNSQNQAQSYGFPQRWRRGKGLRTEANRAKAGRADDLTTTSKGPLETDLAPSLCQLVSSSWPVS